MSDKRILTTITEYITTIIQKTGFLVFVSVIPHPIEQNGYVISLTSQEDARLIIGKDGQHLCALEYLAKLALLKKFPEFCRACNYNIILDIDNYRLSKDLALIETLQGITERVLKTKKAEILPPMTAYERKIIHNHIARVSQLVSESIGQEPRRRVLIKPC